MFYYFIKIIYIVNIMSSGIHSSGFISTMTVSESLTSPKTDLVSSITIYTPPNPLYPNTVGCMTIGQLLINFSLVPYEYNYLNYPNNTIQFLQSFSTVYGAVIIDATAGNNIICVAQIYNEYMTVNVGGSPGLGTQFLVNWFAWGLA